MGAMIVATIHTSHGDKPARAKEQLCGSDWGKAMNVKGKVATDQVHNSYSYHHHVTQVYLG